MGEESFKMGGGGLSPGAGGAGGAGAAHHSALTPQMAKNKEKLSDALKSCNEILKELFSKKHSVSDQALPKMAIFTLFPAIYITFLF